MAQTSFITPTEQAAIDTLVASGLYGEFVQRNLNGTYVFTGPDYLGHNFHNENTLLAEAAKVGA